MSVEESVVVKKDKRSKTHHGEPREPGIVISIIGWRDDEKMTWQAIGDKLGMTRAGARHLYNRWHNWSKEVSSPPLSPKT